MKRLIKRLTVFVVNGLHGENVKNVIGGLRLVKWIVTMAGATAKDMLRRP